MSVLPQVDPASVVFGESEPKPEKPVPSLTDGYVVESTIPVADQQAQLLSTPRGIPLDAVQEQMEFFASEIAQGRVFYADVPVFFSALHRLTGGVPVNSDVVSAYELNAFLAFNPTGVSAEVFYDVIQWVLSESDVFDVPAVSAEEFEASRGLLLSLHGESLGALEPLVRSARYGSAVSSWLSSDWVQQVEGVRSAERERGVVASWWSAPFVELVQGRGEGDLLVELPSPVQASVVPVSSLSEVQAGRVSAVGEMLREELEGVSSPTTATDSADSTDSTADSTVSKPWLWSVVAGFLVFACLLSMGSVFGWFGI